MTQYIEENIEEKQRYNHLAGIVPIAGRALDFGMPWHDSLMPIDQYLNLAESAIINCAWMGCDTIWVVVNEDVSPLLRKRIGDSIKDPVGWDKMGQGFSWRWYRPRRREIPIYYVRTNPVDFDKRDSISYSVLHGARISSKICTSLTRWVTPERFFISWPYCVYDAEELSKRYRKEIKSSKSSYIFSDGVDSIKTTFLPAILSPRILNKAREAVHANSSGVEILEQFDVDKKWWRLKDSGGNLRFPKMNRKLKASERDSARWHHPKDVFGFIEEEELDIKMLHLEEFHLIKSWDSYRKFLSSGFEFTEEYNIIRYNETGPVGYTFDELEKAIEE